MTSILLTGAVHLPFVLLFTAMQSMSLEHEHSASRLTTFDVSLASDVGAMSSGADQPVAKPVSSESTQSAMQVQDQVDRKAPEIVLLESPSSVKVIHSFDTASQSASALDSGKVTSTNVSFTTSQFASGHRGQMGKGMASSHQSTGQSGAQPESRAGQDGGVNQTDAYQAVVHQWIERHKSFPQRLAIKGVNGTVTIVFELDRKGRIYGARIERSSGNRELDALAVEQLAMAAPYPRPSRDSHWHRRSFTVPMTYRPS